MRHVSALATFCPDRHRATSSDPFAEYPWTNPGVDALLRTGYRHSGTIFDASGGTGESWSLGASQYGAAASGDSDEFPDGTGQSRAL